MVFNNILQFIFIESFADDLQMHYLQILDKNSSIYFWNGFRWYLQTLDKNKLIICHHCADMSFQVLISFLFSGVNLSSSFMCMSALDTQNVLSDALIAKK